MEKIQTVKTSRRFLAFVIDMLLIGLTMQLLTIILKTPIENMFHLEALNEQYYELGISSGLFDSAHNAINTSNSALVEQFLQDVKPITDELYRNQMIVACILALISSSIFQFIIPACVGEGRSIGKIIAKLRVVKKDGSKINFLSIFLRGFVGMTLIEYVVSIPLSFFPFVLSAVLVFASNNKRALHDYVSGTKVAYAEGFEPEVKEREKPIYEHDHKSVKGFEYIDIEALEKRERESQERMAKANGENISDEVKQEEKQEEVKQTNINDITMDEIERKEQLALERMKQKEALKKEDNNVIDVESKDINSENK